MSDLVIDSSVAIKWFVVEPLSIEAGLIFDGYQNGSFSFSAPDLINAEFGNIVWKKHLYQGLDVADAKLIIESFRRIEFTFVPTADLLEQAYELAVTHQRTVYDMVYLALSLRENCRIVTADERLVNAIGSSFTNVIWLGNWS